jgi:hypothetical protein
MDEVNDMQPDGPIWKSTMREPLLHFVLLGGLIFAADNALRARQNDPRLILVGPEVEREASTIFRSAKGRDPSPQELAILRERWIDNEVLYREGLALRLEQGDTALRERVIFKALNVIESNLRVPDIDQTGLQDWFEKHRDQYDTPARYDFSEAVPSDSSEPALRQFAEVLNRAGSGAEVQSGLRIFEGRPADTIASAFGSEFSAALERLPLREWHVVPSSDGLRIIRIEAREPGARVQFEQVRGRVIQDWTDAKAQELRTAAIRELAKKYTVRHSGAES